MKIVDNAGRDAICSINRTYVRSLRELAEKGILQSRQVGRSVVYEMASNELAASVLRLLRQDKLIVSKVSENVVAELKKLKPVSITLFGSALKGLKAGRDSKKEIITEALEKRSEYGYTEKKSDAKGANLILVRAKRFLDWVKVRVCYE